MPNIQIYLQGYIHIPMKWFLGEKNKVYNPLVLAFCVDRESFFYCLPPDI